MQMCVIEMIDREEQTFYHLENFIEGDYVKYNSNSGYVLDDDVRYTPQVCYCEHLFYFFVIN